MGTTHTLNHHHAKITQDILGYPRIIPGCLKVKKMGYPRIIPGF
jgi:hypothetical protein